MWSDVHMKVLKLGKGDQMKHIKQKRKYDPIYNIRICNLV